MYNRCNFTHKSLIERIRESFGEKFPDILKEFFLPLLGLPVRNSMFKRLFRMAPQWALCHRMLTVFKIPGQKKKDIGMCKSLYVVNSGFNQPSFFFFFRSNHSWCFTCKPWLRTFEKRQVADFCWTYNESIEVGPHKSCWKNISKSRMFRKWWLHVITLQFFLYFHMCFDTFTTWSSKSTTIQRSRSIGRLRRWGKNWGENRPVDELLIEKPSKVEVPLPPNPCQKQTY